MDPKILGVTSGLIRGDMKRRGLTMVAFPKLGKSSGLNYQDTINFMKRLSHQGKGTTEASGEEGNSKVRMVMQNVDFVSALCCFERQTDDEDAKDQLVDPKKLERRSSVLKRMKQK